jgi:hypothetical protein
LDRGRRALHSVMDDISEPQSPISEPLPLAVLDFVGIEYGEDAAASLAGAVGIAQAVEAAGYRRYWVSEHHNMRSLACSAPTRIREVNAPTCAISSSGALQARLRMLWCSETQYLR